MKNRCFFLLFFSSILFTSCDNNDSSSKIEDVQKQAESQLWKEIIAVHDEVMPKMGAINKLQRELKNVLKNSKIVLDSESLENVGNTLKKLVRADDAMIEWMQGFRQLETLQAQQTHEQILLYLKQEKVAINDVKELINTAIEDGQTLLNNFAE